MNFITKEVLHGVYTMDTCSILYHHNLTYLFYTSAVHVMNSQVSVQFSYAILMTVGLSTTLDFLYSIEYSCLSCISAIACISFVHVCVIVIRVFFIYIFTLCLLNDDYANTLTFLFSSDHREMACYIAGVLCLCLY